MKKYYQCDLRYALILLEKLLVVFEGVIDWIGILFDLYSQHLFDLWDLNNTNK